MLDVHAPHGVLDTWKDFIFHIATIVVGLFIAVALEQSVEALHNQHRVSTLRTELRGESRQIAADAAITEAAFAYELRWLRTRIAQVQDALWKHKSIGPGEPNDMPRYLSPDIPIWRSAKAGGRIALLTTGEVNAYAEIEYAQKHLEEHEVFLDRARSAVRSFNREFPALATGGPDLSYASPEDLRRNLGLLTSAYEAIDSYMHWLQIITGAESEVVRGETSLDKIYSAERNASGGNVSRNFM